VMIIPPPPVVMIIPPPPVVMILFPLKLKTPSRPKVPRVPPPL
jgi:hypothetical protein